MAQSLPLMPDVRAKGVQKEKRLAERGRILIADDEESVLLSTADLLRIEGYECTCAADAKTAFEKLRKNRYDKTFVRRN